MKNIIIAGGGTFGHIRPALTLKNWLEKESYNVFYSCALRDKKFPFFNKEKNILPLDFVGLPRTKNIFRLMQFFYKLVLAMIKSLFYVIKLKPKIIIITGGFVSFPYLFWAKFFRKPYFICEQNSIPGLVNRIFFKGAKKIFLSIPIKNRNIMNNLKNAIITGNPIELNIYTKKEASEALKIPYFENKKYVLVFGGSQGAKAINDVFIKNLDRLFSLEDYFFILVTGDDTDIDENNVKTFRFIENMGTAYSLSDFVVSRAGASTVSELIYFKKPAILIPYPYATENHQFYNAEFAIENIPGFILLEKDTSFDKIVDYLGKLNNTEKILYSSLDTKNLIISEVNRWI